MRKEAGYTLVEILVVVVLLGVLLSILWNVFVQNAFQQKRIKNEMEAQNSAKALLNHIGEVVMEQNVPVVTLVDGFPLEEESDYTGEYSFIDFENGAHLEKLSANKYKLNDKIYSYIKEVRLDINKNGRGLTATVVGVSEKAEVEYSSSFYTRNT